MYINKKVLFSFLILFTVLFITPIVYAATSADFQQKAQKEINNTCSKRSPSNEQSLLCFLYFKVQELTQANSLIQGQTTNNTNTISTLQNKVASVEASLDNAPKTKTVVFADNKPASFNSQWIDVRGGYDTLTMTLNITGNIAGYGLHFTNDPQNATDQSGYIVQKDINCNFTSSCPVTTIPILGDYYRISTGTSNGNVISSGILKAEKGVPYDKLVNVCFDVSTGNLKVLQGTSCHPHVRWQIPVKCVTGEPCKPDNPDDLYFLHNN